MMMFFMFLIFFMIMFKLFNKFLIQMVYQNILLLMFLFLMMNFPFNNIGNWMMIYYMFGMDFYSMMLIMLSLWVLILMVMVSGKIFISLNYMFYMNLLMMLLMFLILCFFTMNLMMFYIFFESSLIPVFLMIMGWGNNIDRIQASVYMMLYTLVGSMPLFLIIIYLYMLEMTMMMDLMIITQFNLFIYLMLIVAFLIKMPMYMFHLWLPKAHVEAPLMGSMILAGVMLKLGSYGLMRVMLMMMDMCLKFNKFIMLFSLMGGVYSSLICLCQIDMKMLVAYSSVVHMSILMSGMMTMYLWGFLGSLLLMVAHGLCSSGLFCLVNISYERLMSRSLYINKGLINYFPSLSLMWFLLCSSNLSFPPSLNLFGEIFLLNSLIMWSKLIIIILMLLLFFSASYSLYLYSYSQHGKINLLNFSFLNIKMMEFMTLLLHWVPLNLLFLCMFMFM